GRGKPPACVSPPPYARGGRGSVACRGASNRASHARRSVGEPARATGVASFRGDRQARRSSSSPTRRVGGTDSRPRRTSTSTPGGQELTLAHFPRPVLHRKLARNVLM